MKYNTLIPFVTAVLAACAPPAPPNAIDPSSQVSDAATTPPQDGAAGDEVEAPALTPDGTATDTTVAATDAGGIVLDGQTLEDAATTDAVPEDAASVCIPLNATVAGSAVFGLTVLGDGTVAAVNSGPVSQGVGEGANLHMWDGSGKPLTSQVFLGVGTGRPILVNAIPTGLLLAGIGKTTGTKKLWLVRTDPVGTKATIAVFGPSDKDWSGTAASAPDGHVCFAGTEGTPGQAGVGILALIDPASNLVLSKSMPGLIPRAVAPMAGGKWLVWSRLAGSDANWSQGENALQVVGANGEAGPQVPTPGPGGPGSSAIAVGNGGVWLVRSTQPDAEAYPYIRVDYVSLGGEALWSWQHPGAPKTGDGPRYAYGVALQGNGDVVVAGMDDPAAGLLARLDPAGKLLWSKVFPAAKAKVGLGGLTAVASTPDGGLVIGGASAIGGWVAVLNACGGFACAASCTP